MARPPSAARGAFAGPAVSRAALLQPGRPWPFGARVDGDGVNFAVFSAHATLVELCLFDDAGTAEVERFALPGRSGDVWHGRLPGAAAGLVYGFRAHGPWAPHDGQRFNPAKLLLDPYAREIVGEWRWDARLRGDDAADPSRPDPRDSAPVAPKARVVGPEDDFDWGDDRPPAVPAGEAVLYELHVRGFTRRHPLVDPAARGTFAGLASAPAVEHLQRLGVTTLSLLPVQQFVDEQRLVAMGLSNYWGYNTLGYFCPHPRYAAAGAGRAARDEFRAMVRALHRAGIEVIVDVVYNHTAETDELGPTVCWRGLDNASWYRLVPGARERYVNDTGCGNTLDFGHPRVRQMALDSLRWWVQAMHVDGFRFDLATVLGRGDAGFDAHSAFFHCLAQDPVLGGVKLIAEPWDIGPGGYQLGRFPAGWLEWNDRFRDAVRAFWLGGATTRGEFARRLCASSDLFEHDGRRPSASVNFVTAHDGFTLRDLVSHDRRHNEANGEDNRDGHSHNLSWNCGVEGPTDDPQVLALRERLQRALLATLLLAQGTPMIAAGDEIGHSQGGNNNPYCQDNETTWIDWSTADAALAAFTARLVELRRTLRPLGDAWTTGRPGPDGRIDLAWLRSNGQPMHPEHWDSTTSRCLGAWIGAPGGGGPAIVLLFNAADADSDFHLPPGRWRVLLDTAHPDAAPATVEACCVAPARSVRLLQAL